MTTAYKLQVELANGAKFTGEGPEKAVKEDYKAFIEAQGGQQSANGKPPQNHRGRDAIEHQIELPDASLQRVFAVDEGGSVSLRILPRTERRDADALILLLYGFKTLGNSPDVNSGVLMQAVRQSGLQLTRIDQTISFYQNLITEGGLRRGKRYGLNNQGVNHAQQLIQGML
jgi:hypothetical protein